MHVSFPTLLSLLSLTLPALSLPQAGTGAEATFAYFYYNTPGCPTDLDSIDSTSSANRGQEVYCEGGNIEPFYQVRAKNLALNGMKLLVYYDVGCAHLATDGEITEDDVCYTAPKDNPIQAWSFVNA